MKVAVNTRLLLAHRIEGVARFIFETTKSMVESHPNIKFHYIFDRPFDSNFITADNIIPHVIGPPARHPILWWMWFEYSIPKLLRKLDCDVFYTGDMYMSLKTQIPTLMVSHDLNYLHYPEGLKWSHLKYYQKYMPIYHKKADHLIAVSEATKLDVIDKYGVKNEKISVAYNSCPEGFKPVDDVKKIELKDRFTAGAPFIMYVGSLHPRKNIERLLKAFDQFKKSKNTNHKLVLFGRMAWKTSPIFKTLNDLAYKHDVIFLGNADVEVKELLPAADALCYVSLFEGFGIPILEAFASGVPVITSNVSSMPEVAGDAALLVDPKDVNQIANALTKVSSNKDLANAMIEKGFKKLEHFSWKDSANIIMNQLQKLVNS